MLVTTKGRYALAALADLAAHAGQGAVPLRDVAARQSISEKYLESIVKSLADASLVTGTRGKGGGYELARPADETTVLEVLDAVEGDFKVAEDLEGAASPAQLRSAALFDEIDAIVRERLGDETVADLAQGEDAGDYYVI